jgi:uncharacterized protein (TIGR03437 family)
MKCFSAYFVGILILIAGNSAAQTSGAVKVYTVPTGRLFHVDGVYHQDPTAHLWTAGTKHVLGTDKGQETGIIKTRYAFQDWKVNGGTVLTTNPVVTVTADPSLKEFYATFTVEHALTLNISTCVDTNCTVAGKVYVNGTSYSADADIYFSHGSTVKLMAEPAAGFVFDGWEAGPLQQITGFLNTVTLNGPAIVRPRFLLARGINLVTEPAELDLYADRARVSTPRTLDWAYGSTHTLGVPTPQMDKFGRWYIFSKWSDGVGENRSYTVQPSRVPETFTAIFVPSTSTDLRTSPPGLNVVVDGRDNWNTFLFPWGAGETHQIEAPQQQTDAQGRLWQFSSWSNGGGRAQSYTVPVGQMGETIRLTAVYTPLAQMTVTSAVSGLTIQVDGADCATPCEVQKAVGTVVRVSAPGSLALGENSRSDFEGWPGSGSLSPEWAVTLAHDPLSPHLTYRTLNRLVAAANPAEGASWRMQPASPDGFYDVNETVTVTAVSEPGFRFRRWAGDASGSAPATSVSMNAPRRVEAMLERIPYIAPAGVANAAGGPPENGVAPGSIVSIFGSSFAPETLVGADSPLGQAIGCLTVRLGSRLMPLFFISPSQINFQLPEDTPVGEHRLVVSCEGLPDVDATFQVGRNAPGLFPGAVLHEDGSVVTVESPARRGELLTIYGTGFGPAAVPRPFGFAPVEPSAVVDPVVVQVGDVAITPERAFAVAGRVGLDAVQFRLPEGAAGRVSVTVSGKSSNSVEVW